MKNFIPKPYTKDPITIRIDTDKIAEIDRLALGYGMNRSEFINRCIDFAMENMPKK